MGINCNRNIRITVNFFICTGVFWIAASGFGRNGQNPCGNRKLWMHVAVTFGLLAALGGTRFFMVMSDGLDYASTSMLMLFLTGSAYTALCVRSFIAARKAREDAIES